MYTKSALAESIGTFILIFIGGGAQAAARLLFDKYFMATDLASPS